MDTTHRSDDHDPSRLSSRLKASSFAERAAARIDEVLRVYAQLVENGDSPPCPITLRADSIARYSEHVQIVGKDDSAACASATRELTVEGSFQM